MKTVTFNAVALAMMCLTFGCDDDDPKTVTIPFEATFFTNLATLEERSECGVDPLMYNAQEGSGVATELGEFDTRITFCVSLETLKYFNGQGVFTASDGDELYFTIEGQINPAKNPDYLLEFHDPFVFTGGTGRFEGAKGKGMTNSLVNHGRVKTDHVWTGELILRK